MYMCVYLYLPILSTRLGCENRDARDFPRAHTFRNQEIIQRHRKSPARHLVVL